MGLLRAAGARLPPGVTLEILDINLPLYDGDVENEGVPAKVAEFKAKVAAADAVLFASPEYNFSITGALKNALDWASRTPNAFADKPAAVMGAGGGAGTVVGSPAPGVCVPGHPFRQQAGCHGQRLRAWQLRHGHGRPGQRRHQGPGG